MEKARRPSGNVVHNLRHALSARQRGDAATPDWARDEVARALVRHDAELLARLLESDLGRQAHPRLDRFLPLLYAAGVSGPEEPVRFPITGFDMASLSMRSVALG